MKAGHKGPYASQVRRGLSHFPFDWLRGMQRAVQTAVTGPLFFYGGIYDPQPIQIEWGGEGGGGKLIESNLLPPFTPRKSDEKIGFREGGSPIPSRGHGRAMVGQSHRWNLANEIPPKGPQEASRSASGGSKSAPRGARSTPQRAQTKT